VLHGNWNCRGDDAVPFDVEGGGQPSQESVTGLLPNWAAFDRQNGARHIGRISASGGG
jgi:hypothetical protein